MAFNPKGRHHTPSHLTSLSICSRTSLSLKYVFHRLSGFGFRGCRRETSVTWSVTVTWSVFRVLLRVKFWNSRDPPASRPLETRPGLPWRFLAEWSSLARTGRTDPWPIRFELISIMTLCKQSLTVTWDVILALKSLLLILQRNFLRTSLNQCVKMREHGLLNTFNPKIYPNLLLSSYKHSVKWSESVCNLCFCRKDSHKAWSGGR